MNIQTRGAATALEFLIFKTRGRGIRRELTSTVKQGADNARQANQVAVSAAAPGSLQEQVTSLVQAVSMFNPGSEGAGQPESGSCAGRRPAGSKDPADGSAEAGGAGGWRWRLDGVLMARRRRAD